MDAKVGGIWLDTEVGCRGWAQRLDTEVGMQRLDAEVGGKGLGAEVGNRGWMHRGRLDAEVRMQMFECIQVGRKGWT